MEGIDEGIRANSEAVGQEDYRDENVEKKEKILKTYQRRHKSMNGRATGNIVVGSQCSC